MNTRIAALLMTLLLTVTLLPAYAADVMGLVSFSSGVAGEPSPYPDVSLPVGSTYTLPAGPESGPFGLSFRDWSVNGEGRYVPGTVITVVFRTYISPNWSVPGTGSGSGTDSGTAEMGVIHYSTGWDGTPLYPKAEAPVGSTFVLPAAPTFGIIDLPFEHWEIDGVSYNPGDTAVVKSMTIVQAVWGMPAAAEPDPSGTVSIHFLSGWSPDKGGLSPGTMPDLTVPTGGVFVLPECSFRVPEGYRFVGWRIREQFYSPGQSLPAQDNYTAVATWERTDVTWPESDTFTVRISVDMGQGGTTFPSGEVTVSRGESLTIQMLPDPGYYVAVLQVNGRTTEPVSTLTLQSISVPYRVHVAFAPTQDGVTPPASDPVYPAPTPLPDVPEIPAMPEIPVIPEIPAIPDTPVIPEPETPAEPLLYGDVPGDVWYAPDVSFVTEEGLMNGVGDGLFDPGTVTSRAMLVTILWRMEGEPITAPDADFSDVPGNTWYTDAVNWAADRGIVGGYGDGRFGPDDSLTREQMLAILHRYALSRQWTDSSRLPIARQYGYSDWAEESVFWGDNNGLLEDWGVDVTDQTAAVTRAEAAACLTRFCRRVCP